MKKGNPGDKQTGGDELGGGTMWQQLRKLINVIDELRDVGLQQYIKLPRIAVLGTQSSGKSSVLESIVGLDFLPRGDGVCTRRPLELRLVHMTDPNTKPWGKFDEVKDKKFFDFTEVCKMVNTLTDKVAGLKKGIVDRPIILTVYSHTCPDLTIIDLPGITRIPLKDSDQPENIEEITKAMALRYVNDPRTIILAVMPANQDLTTSEALMISRNLDPSGIRTVGVITKIDIMDKGTNAKRVLTGQEVPLRLGYVGVKNRSQADIDSKMTVAKALNIEADWFATHPVYGQLPEDMCGTKPLSTKLTKILFTHIKHHLPEIIREIQERVRDCESKLKDLGPEIPLEDAQKMQLVWNMVNDFCLIFRNTISGRFDLKRGGRKNAKELTGGAKIKMLFYNLFKEYDTSKHSATSEYSDRDIERAIILHEGDSLPGFPSADVFIYLIQPQLEKLKEPATDCLIEVFTYLEMLAREIADKTFMRFPLLADEVIEVVTQVFVEERDRAKYLVKSIIESEQGYMFTNDSAYLQQRTDIIPKDTPGVEKKTDPANVYVMEMRARIEAYFKIVVRNIRDLIPKLVGFFLVRSSEEKMQFALYNRIAINFETLNNLLGEPPEVMRERKGIMNTLSTLKNAIKVLQRDPELATSMSGADTELMGELEREKVSKADKKRDKSERHKGPAEGEVEQRPAAPSLYGDGPKKAKNPLFN